MATEFKLIFVFQQETKGAVRYGEMLPSGRIAMAPNDPGSHIGTLYVRKTAYDNNANFPKKLSVTVIGTD